MNVKCFWEYSVNVNSVSDSAQCLQLRSFLQWPSGWMREQVVLKEGNHTSRTLGWCRGADRLHYKCEFWIVCLCLYTSHGFCFFRAHCSSWGGGYFLFHIIFIMSLSCHLTHSAYHSHVSCVTLVGSRCFSQVLSNHCFVCLLVHFNMLCDACEFWKVQPYSHTIRTHKLT